MDESVGCVDGLLWSEGSVELTFL